MYGNLSVGLSHFLSEKIPEDFQLKTCLFSAGELLISLSSGGPKFNPQFEISLENNSLWISWLFLWVSVDYDGINRATVKLSRGRFLCSTVQDGEGTLPLQSPKPRFLHGHLGLSWTNYDIYKEIWPLSPTTWCLHMVYFWFLWCPLGDEEKKNPFHLYHRVICKSVSEEHPCSWLPPGRSWCLLENWVFIQMFKARVCKAVHLTYLHKGAEEMIG